MPAEFTVAAENRSSVEPEESKVGKKISSSPRLLGLDLLRFLAVTLVIFRHLSLSGSPTSLSYRIFHAGYLGGWIGVTVFFVLSGFLISGLLFREYQKDGHVRVGRFLIRRGWKIYPALWAMVAFSVLLWDFGLWEGFSRRGLIAEGLFLQNYLGGLWFTTWSLGVEEHFYFLFAALVVLMFHFRKKDSSAARNPFWLVPVLFLVMEAGCLIGRIFAAHRLNPDMVMTRIVYPSHLRIDSLMLGVLLSYWWHFSPEDRFRELMRRWRIPLCVLGAACLAPAFIWDVDQHPWLAVYGVMIFSAGSGFLILGILSFSSLERVPLLKPIGKLGTFSYSAYIWHGPFVVLGMWPLRKHFAAHWNNWIEFTLLFVATWMLGIVAAKAVEIPVLRLRERYVPARLPALK